jgi:predicted TIM-barrel fold metal-dependent hydrolase
MLSTLLLVCTLFVAPPPESTRAGLIDVHGHLSPSAGERIKKLMDRSGVKVLVNLSGGNFRRGMRENIALAQQLPGRIVNAYNPDWDEIDEPWWGLREAMALEAAVTQYGYRGLKISKALGLYLRDRNKVLIDVDDPRLDPLWEKAGELGIPVSIHTSDPKAFWEPRTPDNERYDELEHHPDWAFGDKPVPSREALLAMRDRVVDRHPLTTFVLVHFANNPEDITYVDRLLNAYPNAMVDLAARVPEIGRHDPKQVRDLFIRHADRILFGTDIGIGPRFLMLGSTGGDQPTDEDAATFYTTHYRFLETHDRQFDHPTPIQGRWKIDGISLPPAVLKKIYRTNAIRVFGLPRK